MAIAWTSQEDALLEGYAKGELTLDEVSIQTGRTKLAVSGRSHKRGLTKRVWNTRLPAQTIQQICDLYRQGETLQKIQGDTGLSYHQVRWCLKVQGLSVDRRRASLEATKEKRRVFKVAEIEKTKTLWDGGISEKDIAAELGCCKQVLRRLVSEQGWARSAKDLRGNRSQRKVFSEKELQHMVRAYVRGLDGLTVTARHFGTSKSTLRRCFQSVGIDFGNVSRKKHSALLKRDFRRGKRVISPRTGRGIRSYCVTPFQGRVLLRSQDEARRVRELVGTAWFYEINRYTLSTGGTYLPDFWETGLPEDVVRTMFSKNPTKQDILSLLRGIPHRIVDVKGWWGPQHPSWDKIQQFRREFPNISFHLLVNDKNGGWSWE